jgi:hypothetical protein
MTASLLVFAPVALLALVAGFYFVGCVLDKSGLPGGDPEPKPFTKYSDTDVIGHSAIAAYWRLSEPASVAGNPVATAKATDVIGGKNGNYTHKGNAPELFPCPGFQVAPGVDSAQASGFLSLGVEAIVPGDAKQPPSDPPVLLTGMQVDGAFVTVPVNGTVNQTGSFSVEAWVRPDWTAMDSPAKRILIDSHDDNGSTGFVIGVGEGGSWEASLGFGTGFLLLPGSPAILSMSTHVVVTFDGNNKAEMFLNGARVATQMLPAGAGYVANTTVPFIIGAGLPGLPKRTQPTDLLFFPLLPFKGTVQDVAIYSAVLSDADILTHFTDGSGMHPPVDG